jgi:hypothetical protein
LRLEREGERGRERGLSRLHKFSLPHNRSPRSQDPSPSLSPSLHQSQIKIASGCRCSDNGVCDCTTSMVGIFIDWWSICMSALGGFAVATCLLTGIRKPPPGPPLSASIHCPFGGHALLLKTLQLADALSRVCSPSCIEK